MVNARMPGMAPGRHRSAGCEEMARNCVRYNPPATSRRSSPAARPHGPPAVVCHRPGPSVPSRIAENQKIGAYSIVRMLGQAGWARSMKASTIRIGRRAAIAIPTGATPTTSRIVQRFINGSARRQHRAAPEPENIYEFARPPGRQRLHRHGVSQRRYAASAPSAAADDWLPMSRCGSADRWLLALAGGAQQGHLPDRTHLRRSVAVAAKKTPQRWNGWRIRTPATRVLHSSTGAVGSMSNMETSVPSARATSVRQPTCKRSMACR